MLSLSPILQSPNYSFVPSADFISSMEWVLAFVVIGVIGVVAIKIIRHYLIERDHLLGGEDSMVTLMVTIPRFRNQDEAKQNDAVAAMREKISVAEAVFSAIGGLKPQHGLSAWFLGRSDVIAFEIVAYKKLITFYITVTKGMRNFLEQQLNAQWSDAQFEELPDYNMFAPHSTILGGYLTLKRKSVFPIKTYKDLDSDPLNSLTNALSKVSETDGVAIQYVIRPVHSHWRRLGSRIVRRMNDGKSMHEAEYGKGFFGKLSDWTRSKEDREKKDQKKRERKMSQAETKMAEGIENKITKAGMEVNIRIVACASSPEVAKSYLDNVFSAFNQFNIYEFGNSFQTVLPRSKDRLVRHFIYRQFSEKHAIILNSEEISSLWHLPLPSSDTPNIRWMLARTAPAPITMPTEGLRIGFNKYRGKITPCFMTLPDRRRHLYIIGKTGSGKSEFIKNLIAQDIANGNGVVVVDPHGDLAEQCLTLVPKDRVDDVIYFDPGDLERPFGLNMMEFDPAHPAQRDNVIQDMLAIFDQLYDLKATGGPMFEQYMRGAMMLLMEDVESGATLLEISKVLSDEEYRNMKLSKCKNRVVLDFWQKEATKAGGEASLANMVPYITSKLTPMIANEYLRPIITQQKSTINFPSIIANKKILLVNLNKGKIGELNASLLGMIIIAKLQLAAFSQGDILEKDRIDCFCYIDEFQNFVTPSIATILSEARKYRLCLIMAHQYMAQLTKNNDTKIRDAVMGNVGSFLVARVGPDDTDVLEKVFQPTFSAYDLMNTTAQMWSAKILVNGAQEKPFTLYADPMVFGSKAMAEGLKQISRYMYGRDREEVEEETYTRSGMAPLRSTAPKASAPEMPEGF